MIAKGCGGRDRGIGEEIKRYNFSYKTNGGRDEMYSEGNTVSKNVLSLYWELPLWLR